MARHRGRVGPHRRENPSGKIVWQAQPTDAADIGTFRLKGRCAQRGRSDCCCQHALDAWYDAREGGAVVSPDTATMRAFLPIWRDKYKRDAGSTNQKNRYRIEAVLDIEIKHRRLGDMPLSTIDSSVVSDLRALMIDTTTGKGWKVGYARNLLSTLSAFCGDAVEHYGGGTNPFWRAANRLPTQPAKPRDERWQPWTLIQMRNIADAAEDRYKAMMHTLATGGFRRGELLALARMNVDWNGCRVYIEGTEHNGQWSPSNRHKNHDRWVWLPDDVMQMLADHPPYMGCKWLFYTPGQVRKPRIDWPPYEELMAEIEGTSYSAVSRRLGVSDNAVRNRLRNHAPGVEPAPPTGGGKMWWGDNFMRDVFRPTCDRAGVRASPQQFRASLNQHMIAEGISDNDRTALLGHDIKVNRDHYSVIEIQDIAAIRRALA